MIQRKPTQLHTRLFEQYFEWVKKTSSNLYSNEYELSIRKRIDILQKNWRNAYDGIIDTEKENILEFGLLLSRVAETHSRSNIARDVMEQLAEHAKNRTPWILEPSSVLISTGEFNRRLGNLERAQTYYNEAIQILESELGTPSTNEQNTHKELGRLFYELAYLHRLRGNALETQSAMERSENECVLAEDSVGAEIARSVQATILYEEGNPETAIEKLKDCLSHFERIVTDPAIQKTGRVNFAIRWKFNASAHLIQAYLVDQQLDNARSEFEKYLNGQDNPSDLWKSSVKRIEAKIHLAENNLELAHESIHESKNSIPEDSRLEDAEGAASLMTIAGLIHALEGDLSSAKDLFDKACLLPSDLHNHAALGLAWAAQAIITKDLGDEESYITCIQKGLEQVQHCGAPIRRFLQKLQDTGYRDKNGPGISHLRLLSLAL